jgi:predicted esterase
VDVLRAGEPLERARAAAVLLHGRGASARDMLTTEPLRREGFALMAPQAPIVAQGWWPRPFTAPLADNEPALSDALDTMRAALAEVGDHIAPDRVLLLGFSQGACLALEFAARNPRRYGGVVGWSGGLVGADGEFELRAGSLDGTPVLLGCSDADPYIPQGRLRATAEVLRELGAEVDLQVYPGLGHEVNADELARVTRLMEAVLRREEVA